MTCNGWGVEKMKINGINKDNLKHILEVRREDLKELEYLITFYNERRSKNEPLYSRFIDDTERNILQMKNVIKYLEEELK